MPSLTHTLSNGTVTAVLPADMLWSDEYESSPLKSRVTLTLDGGVLVEQSVLVKGRPITLSGNEDRGWLSKAELDHLAVLASAAGVLTLTLADDRVFSVMFGSEPIKARGLWPLAFPTSTDWYVVTISLIQV